jgi:hypothetical protein
MEWNGMEWNGMEWNGMERNGIMGNGNHEGSDLKPSHAFCRWRGCPLPKSPMHSLCPTYILRKVYLLDTFMPVEYIFQTVLKYFVSSYQPDVAGLMMFNFLSSSFSFFSSPFFTSFFFCDLATADLTSRMRKLSCQAFSGFRKANETPHKSYWENRRKLWPRVEPPPFLDSPEDSAVYKTIK